MSSTDQAVQVYQLRIWIRHISPQIWRRLLVQSSSTIAQLHDTLQIVFGWTDEHLHRFLIRGKPYGIGRPGGMSFDDNPHQVQLRDFHFRSKETWVYEYDLTDWWQHEIRLEQVLPFDPTKHYPYCLAGKRRGPIVIWRKICQEVSRNDMKNPPYRPSSAVFSLGALLQPPEATPTGCQGTTAISALVPRLLPARPYPTPPQSIKVRRCFPSSFPTDEVSPPVGLCFQHSHLRYFPESQIRRKREKPYMAVALFHWTGSLLPRNPPPVLHPYDSD